jgi:hypothetical protein
MATNLRKAINTADIIRKTNFVLLSAQAIVPNFNEKILISEISNQLTSMVIATSSKGEPIRSGY